MTFAEEKTAMLQQYYAILEDCLSRKVTRMNSNYKNAYLRCIASVGITDTERERESQTLKRNYVDAMLQKFVLQKEFTSRIQLLQEKCLEKDILLDNLNKQKLEGQKVPEVVLRLAALINEEPNQPLVTVLSDLILNSR